MIALRLLDTILNNKAIALLFKITRSDGNALPIKFRVFSSDQVRSQETSQSGGSFRGTEQFYPVCLYVHLFIVVGTACNSALTIEDIRAIGITIEDILGIG